MDKESKEFLKELLSQCGPSGFEEKAQKVWTKRTSKYCDNIEKDVMGNAVAKLNEFGKLKVMLAGHCDEIGFIVTHISSEGFLHIDNIGGIDKSVVPGSQVKVQTSKGLVDGIIGKKAIHLESSSERNSCTKIKDLYVDIGAKNKKDAEKVVSIGDPISFAPNFMELRNGNFSSKGCDDKVGGFVVSEVIKILNKKKSKLNVGVFGTSTVQEEVGLRGATTGAFNINPDVGIAIDVSWTSDTPEASKKELGEVALGKGVVLHPGPANNRILYNLALEIAKDKKIPYQVQASGYPDGTDTSAIQLSRNGTATLLLSIPNRYMHTQVETCNYKDLENTAKLISEIILKIKPNMSFIPR